MWAIGPIRPICGIFLENVPDGTFFIIEFEGNNVYQVVHVYHGTFCITKICEFLGNCPPRKLPH